MSNHEDELYRAQRKAYWLKRFLNYGSTIFIFVAILGYYFYGDIITQSGLLGNFTGTSYSREWQHYHSHSNGVEFYIRVIDDKAEIKAVNVQQTPMKVEVKLDDEMYYSWTINLEPGTEASKIYLVGYNAQFKFIMDSNPI